ncbi:dynamin family protein [Peribacillus huizhouensis]|uniref:GTPase n=1 Tax=Peribacillus huizhouensis TaxID=1501239 RepID=A0ABR6CRV5_9BACI|nr:dynamin family protein [Peribacillus huizhouensis]MBA9027751.1 putative GTPase [Peribacillus huizhouensis]
MAYTDTRQTYNITDLMNLYEKLSEEGDQTNAEKIKELILKSHKEEFVIAFCGHFSAGKSSMINFLLNQHLLPSSPIPTSANTVKVQKGEDFAKIHFRKRKPIIFPAPYDYTAVKTFAKDGDAVSSITISSQDFPLPNTCVIMDTPGIDSTDDAHRISTESALHLADVVFYVMDYNHVQSEVNFLFTRELTEAGKSFYLIVNMIDKHDENELSFEAFKQSAREAFAAWDVIFDGMFFTSIRDLTHSQNEIENVRQFIDTLVQNKEKNREHSLCVSTKRVINQHLSWLKNKYEEAHSVELESLYSLTDTERLAITDDVNRLLEEKYQLVRNIERVKENFEKATQSIVKNAILMPAATRDLANQFLESTQKDFKMGLFFTKKKTDLERLERKKVFLADIQEKVKTQMDWHIKELAVQTVAASGLHDVLMEQTAQSLQVEVPETLLTSLLKGQVQITGEYVLNYTDELSETIKRDARRSCDQFMDQLTQKIMEQNEQRTQELENELKQFSSYLYALELVNMMERELQEEKDQLADILAGKANEQTQVEQILTAWLKEENDVERKIIVQEKSKQQNRAEKKKETEEVSIDQVELQTVTKQMSAKDKLHQTAVSLSEVADLIYPLKGFQSLYSELKEKSKRLENQTFTVALFGAFSAGKSSFANALMGESVLPVSPNPTTAAINKIMAADPVHKHGTAAVKLKTEAMLLEDVNVALTVFSEKAANLEEAHQLSEDIIQRSSNSETGKTQLSFLRAFHAGLPLYKSELGTTLTVDLDGFRQFAAQETKSCLVDLIELYYDCDLTRQGMVLVDTPGADSINARHTGAAFEYIKNSDAILFVTYYNHPFSKADREFLIQLGRVKDSFAMDKMFFIVNAADLANSKEEVIEVKDYVETELASFGIRFPKLFALSSKGALGEKQKQSSFSHAFLPDSGIAQFEAQFNAFIEHDLTDLALQSAKAGMVRTEELMMDVVTTSKQDKETKQKALLALKEDLQKIKQIVQDMNGETDKQRLKKEIDELTFYSKQRVFFRFADFFKECFNPAVIKDDGQDNKVVLKQSLNSLLESIGFDFAQEMRATALRAELFVTKLVLEKQSSILEQVQKVKKNIALKPYEPQNGPIITFDKAFTELTATEFKKELSLFKNPKAFFEKNEKVKMSDALKESLDKPALDYVIEKSEQLYESYQEHLMQQLVSLQKNSEAELAEIFAGLQAALEETIDIPHYEQLAEEIKLLNQK